MRFKARFVWKGALMLGLVAVLGLVVMLLWNGIVPGVFAGARTLDYRHALGLLVLSRILFGGFRGGRGMGGRRWQHLKDLTPEERARFQRGDTRPNRQSESNS
jgi:hypothetical protein